jgi:hypothetical protein
MQGGEVMAVSWENVGQPEAEEKPQGKQPSPQEAAAIAQMHAEFESCYPGWANHAGLDAASAKVVERWSKRGEDIAGQLFDPAVGSVNRRELYGDIAQEMSNEYSMSGALKKFQRAR